ncbi:hypothetical protein EB169_04825 [archaeon]|nr:hypothetical protein [archaeon]
MAHFNNLNLVKKKVTILIITEEEFKKIVENNGFQVKKVTTINEYVNSAKDGVEILKSVN